MRLNITCHSGSSVFNVLSSLQDLSMLGASSPLLEDPQVQSIRSSSVAHMAHDMCNKIYHSADMIAWCPTFVIIMLCSLVFCAIADM